MRNSAPLWHLAALLAVAPLVMAEEVILRDGRKLTGTIAGVESGVYRLETDFGIALIKKEWIARIEFSGAAKGKASREKSLAEKAATAPPVRRRRPAQTHSSASAARQAAVFRSASREPPTSMRPIGSNSLSRTAGGSWSMRLATFPVR